MNELVYSYVRKIPAGKVATYKDVAVGIGYPNNSRQVGRILSQNPHVGFLIISEKIFRNISVKEPVPCHRVIYSDGKIGGFFGKVTADAVHKKELLLVNEGVIVVGGKVNLARFRN